MRKEVVIINTRSLSCIRRGRNLVGQAVTQWSLIVASGLSAVHTDEAQDQVSTVGNESNNVGKSCSLKLTMYWMLLIPVVRDPNNDLLVK